MKEIKKIYTTEDYDLFKKLTGNREVTNSRKQKIKKSILDVGYVTSPILVNENYEIIDGQGRFEALQDLKMPIDFIIEEGIGIKECISMNINQTRWTAQDYINSWADKGVGSYLILKKLQEEYPLITSLELLTTALLGKSKLCIDEIRNGSLIITNEQLESGKTKLDKVYPMIINNKTAKRVLLVAKGILHCFTIDGVDIDLIIKKANEDLQNNKVPSISTVPSIMQYLEEIYNRNKHGNHVYIHTEYLKQMEARERICNTINRKGNE